MYIKPSFGMINTHLLDQNLKELVQFIGTVTRNRLVTLLSFKNLSPEIKLYQTPSGEMIR